jgi:hypothetical protein
LFRPCKLGNKQFDTFNKASTKTPFSHLKYRKKQNRNNLNKLNKEEKTLIVKITRNKISLCFKLCYKNAKFYSWRLFQLTFRLK